MSRPNYVCTLCSAHFTRKYSGRRHNFSVHAGSSEIVPYIQYMVGRNSGQYLASHPSWYRKQRQVQVNRSYQSESRAIPDTASSFRPETLLQPYPAALPNSQTTIPFVRIREFNQIRDIFASKAGVKEISIDTERKSPDKAVEEILSVLSNSTT
jgi:hypothetical protein